MTNNFEHVAGVGFRMAQHESHLRPRFLLVLFLVFLFQLVALVGVKLPVQKNETMRIR